jgi:hypothetical protein
MLKTLQMFTSNLLNVNQVTEVHFPKNGKLASLIKEKSRDGRH